MRFKPEVDRSSIKLRITTPCIENLAVVVLYVLVDHHSSIVGQQHPNDSNVPSTSTVIVRQKSQGTLKGT